MKRLGVILGVLSLGVYMMLIEKSKKKKKKKKVAKVSIPTDQ